MPFTATDLRVSDSGFGLFLGAGASFEAGYPLMSTLTRDVLSTLDEASLNTVDEIINQELGVSLDINAGSPNVESIIDELTARAAMLGPSTPQTKVLDRIISDIQDKIVEVIESVSSPNLDHHVRLLTALARLHHGRAQPLWVITTNYDLLIERAAVEAGIPILDGFLGGPIRYWHVNSFRWSFGRLVIRGTRSVFEPAPQPFVVLIKLHGSIDWWVSRTQNPPRALASLCQKFIPSDFMRCIVLPRRSKVRETLWFPFDQMWNFAINAVGSQCKYLTICGYSLGDFHVNEQLFLNKAKLNQVRLTILLKDFVPGLAPFRDLPNVSWATSNEYKKHGPITEKACELWRFSSLVDLIAQEAGL